ncbi:hypothetical protein N431DRAFT_442410 [Stipitochalara longipes BDJ]|nr:hypothetical protein N431DRAFT_442410 [Stipitochalara longipes BDJ]
MPRGETQFHSLVVGLLYPHEGGQLRVTHEGHSSYFDWSSGGATGSFLLGLRTRNATSDLRPPHNTHFCALAVPYSRSFAFPSVQRCKRDVCLARTLWLKGEALAFFCSHIYEHHRLSASTSVHLPFALKGIDMALFTIFRSLGLSVFVRPMLDPSDCQLSQIDDTGLSKVLSTLLNPRTKPLINPVAKTNAWFFGLAMASAKLPLRMIGDTTCLSVKRRSLSVQEKRRP